MRARSRVIAWLSYPDVKAARVALAAGSLAGLAVLGACSEGTVATKVAGPKVSPPVSEPSFVGVVGANSHTVQVCVDNSSPAGTYNFSVSHNNVQSIALELPAPAPADPVIGGGVIQNSLGPFSPGDVIDAAVSITLPVGALVPECQEVFTRNDTPTHANNRLWDFGSPIGVVNPHGTVDIDVGTIPAGYTFAATCVNDDPLLPQTANCVSPGGITTDPIYSSANVFHGSVVTYVFTAGTTLPPLFLILDEDAIDNGLEPNFFKAKDVNDQIAKLGQRKELKFFDENFGLEIVLWSGRMGDEGWFAPKFIPQSWVDAGPSGDGIENFIGLPGGVGPGLGVGPGDKEAHLDKIPDVTPLRAEGLFMLIGRTVCAVVYDSDISINYAPLNGSLKGATLGIAAFTVDKVEQLTGVSSSSLPKVTITIQDASTVCAGDLSLFLDAPVPLTSSTEVDIVPNGAG